MLSQGPRQTDAAAGPAGTTDLDNPCAARSAEFDPHVPPKPQCSQIGTIGLSSPRERANDATLTGGQTRQRNDLTGRVRAVRAPAAGGHGTALA